MRYYCNFGCKTLKGNNCYFLSEEKQLFHHQLVHKDEMKALEKKEKKKIQIEYPLSSLGILNLIKHLLFII
jgi:hypothetical protein